MSVARADGAGMKAAAWPHDMPKKTRVRASGDDDGNMLKTICSSATLLAWLLTPLLLSDSIRIRFAKSIIFLSGRRQRFASIRGKAGANPPVPFSRTSPIRISYVFAPVSQQ